MDSGALIMALIIFPIYWGIYSAIRARAYGLLCLILVVLLSSFGGCVLFIRNWKMVTYDPPAAIWGRNIFILGILVAIVASIVAIRKARTPKRKPLFENSEENRIKAEQSVPTIPRAPQEGHSDVER